MASNSLRVFSSYELFGYFLPGLVTMVAVMMLLEEGALRGALELPGLITVGVLSAVVVGIGIHAVVAFFERESGRTSRELFREKLGGGPPDRLVVVAMDQAKARIPLRSVKAGPYDLDSTVITGFKEACNETFEIPPFKRTVSAEDDQSTDKMTYEASQRDTIPVWGEIRVPVPKSVHKASQRFSSRWLSKSDGDSGTSDRPRSGSIDDERVGTVGETRDPAQPDRDNWMRNLTDEQWDALYDLVMERVTMNGPSRALRFRAMYGFCRSLSLALLVMSIIYAIGLSFSTAVSQEAMIRELLSRAPFGANIVVGMLFMFSIVFAVEAARFQSRYVDYLVTNLLVIHSSQDETSESG